LQQSGQHLCVLLLVRTPAAVAFGVPARPAAKLLAAAQTGCSIAAAVQQQSMALETLYCCLGAALFPCRRMAWLLIHNTGELQTVHMDKRQLVQVGC
jgi:hypothetical protein